MSDFIVTPEAVRLELDAAGIATRALAKLVDALAQAAVLWIGIFLLAVVLFDSGSDTVGIVAVVVFGFLVLFGYPALSEVLWQGRTIGKAALGLRVVTVEGGPIGFREAALRSMFQILDFFLIPGGALAVITALTNSRSQRIGDLVAGTFVLRERQGLPLSTAVSFPPPPALVGYVASLDPSVIGTDEYAWIRSFLIRVTQLSVPARAELAYQMALPLARQMHQTPPAGVGPEMFLYCVAAAYQQRHGGVPLVDQPPPPGGWSQPPPPGPPPGPPTGWTQPTPPGTWRQPALARPVDAVAPVPPPPPTEGGFTAPD